MDGDEVFERQKFINKKNKWNHEWLLMGWGRFESLNLKKLLEWLVIFYFIFYLKIVILSERICKHLLHKPKHSHNYTQIIRIRRRKINSTIDDSSDAVMTRMWCDFSPILRSLFVFLAIFIYQSSFLYFFSRLLCFCIFSCSGLSEYAENWVFFNAVNDGFMKNFEVE